MGINSLDYKHPVLKNFLSTQGYWGHKKEKLNCSLNIHILGLKNNFVIFNPEYFLEYSKRCNTFCCKVILNNGNLLFVSSDESYDKLTIFFGCRSLQPVHCNKWVGGLLTNNFFKKTCVLITPTLNNNTFILKETSKQLIPIITIEDSDYSSNKAFYSVFGNDDSKKSVCFFYNSISDDILRSLLYNHSKTLLKSN